MTSKKKVTNSKNDEKNAQNIEEKDQPTLKQFIQSQKKKRPQEKNFSKETKKSKQMISEQNSSDEADYDNQNFGEDDDTSDEDSEFQDYSSSQSKQQEQTKQKHQDIAQNILKKIKCQLKTQNKNFDKLKKFQDDEWHCDVAGMINGAPYVIWEPSIASHMNSELKESVTRYKRKHNYYQRVKTKNQFILSESMTNSLIDILSDYQKICSKQETKISNNEPSIQKEKDDIINTNKNQEKALQKHDSLEASKLNNTSLDASKFEKSQEFNSEIEAQDSCINIQSSPQKKKVPVKIEIVQDDDSDVIVKFESPKIQQKHFQNPNDQFAAKSSNVRINHSQQQRDLQLPIPNQLNLPAFQSNNMLSILQNTVTSANLKPQIQHLQNFDQISVMSQQHQIMLLQQQVQQIQQAQQIQQLQNQLSQTNQQAKGANYFKNRKKKFNNFMKKQQQQNEN